WRSWGVGCSGGGVVKSRGEGAGKVSGKNGVYSSCLFKCGEDRERFVVFTQLAPVVSKDLQ
nr:hypothetical protein [Tanacetum cinerariifolium]